MAWRMQLIYANAPFYAMEILYSIVSAILVDMLEDERALHKSLAASPW